MKNDFIINGFAIVDIHSFYQEINKVFMSSEQWQIGESLDALEDLFHGDIGLIEPKKTNEITWLNFDSNSLLLGKDFTLNWYQNKLNQASFDKKHINECIDALKNGAGKTYIEIIIEILGSHSYIKLIKA